MLLQPTLENSQLYFGCWGVAAEGVNLLHFGQNPLALNVVPHLPDLSRLTGLFFLLGPRLSLLEPLYPVHKRPPKGNGTHDDQHI